jgi:hypothetical protein
MITDFSLYMEQGWGALHVFGRPQGTAPTEIAEYKFYAENKPG